MAQKPLSTLDDTVPLKLPSLTPKLQPSASSSLLQKRFLFQQECEALKLNVTQQSVDDPEEFSQTPEETFIMSPCSPQFADVFDCNFSQESIIGFVSTYEPRIIILKFRADPP